LDLLRLEIEVSANSQKPAINLYGNNTDRKTDGIEYFLELGGDQPFRIACLVLDEQ
jgi:hypothetical protein